VVEEGLRRGWGVTTFNRGLAPSAGFPAEHLVGDRLVPADLEQLGARDWDFVVDTWAGAPAAARDSSAVLANRAGRYLYVSSGSVYAEPLPLGVDESAPTVEPGDGDYAAMKRGSELAIEAAFGDRALFARAGTILGPHENVGRLPWWLLRMARGGEVLSPGPPELPLQYIDARDLAIWLLDAASAGTSGPFNVVSRTGHATMGSLLEACRSVTGGGAELAWVDPDFVQSAGIEAWSELPIWLPAGHESRGMHEANVERAHAAGLRCRPLEETVGDTWEWLESIGRRPPLRSDRDPPGLDPAKERAALARRGPGRISAAARS
jgi:nucleoside-diphosphate-sugar epimerase